MFNFQCVCTEETCGFLNGLLLLKSVYSESISTKMDWRIKSVFVRIVNHWFVNFGRQRRVNLLLFRIIQRVTTLLPLCRFSSQLCTSERGSCETCLRYCTSFIVAGGVFIENGNALAVEIEILYLICYSYPSNRISFSI